LLTFLTFFIFLKTKVGKIRKKVEKVKRSLVMFGVTFLLVASIAYAGVLNYYGKIVGIANVKGPTFYASSNSIGGAYYRFLINTLPTSGELTLTDGNVIIFASDSLNVNSWYPAYWSISINVSTNAVNNTLTIQLWILDQNYGWKRELCSNVVTLDSINYKTYSVTCRLDSLSLDPTDRLGLRIGGGGVNSSYTIKVDGTKVEVSSA
jgi:hypothetical protein